MIFSYNVVIFTGRNQRDLVKLTYLFKYTSVYYRTSSIQNWFCFVVRKKLPFKFNGGNGIIFSFRVTDCEQTKSFKFRERLLCHKAINTLKGKT